MNKLNTLFAVLIIGVLPLTLSCDETPGNALDQSDPAAVMSLSLSPTDITFVRSDGIKDTTISIRVDAEITGFDSINATRMPELALFEVGSQGEAVLRNSLQASNDNSDVYSSTFDLTVNTLDFKDYDVFVYVFDQGNISNWVSRRLSVEGFPNAAPEILEVNNPAEVVIPSGPEAVPVTFTAKVTDEDGQNTIREVQILFENEDGSILTPSPNLLLDDGSSESGDFAAGDSVYTITFQVDQNNTPSNRFALYFAIDNSGLSSDTLRLPFNIVEN